MAAAFALAIIQRKNSYSIFVVQDRPRAVLNHFFRRKGLLRRNAVCGCDLAL